MERGELCDAELNQDLHSREFSKSGLQTEEGSPHKASTSQETKNGDVSSLAEAFAAALEPGIANTDASYIATRRFLLHRKSLSGITQRQTWQCNGLDYVLYRHFIRSFQNVDSQRFTSPGDSGRWASPSTPSLSYGRDSGSSSKDVLSFSRGASISSFLNEGERQPRKGPGDSFVGMHCIFDEFKSSVNIVRFGHRSSELLGFGTSDGQIAVCTVVEPPGILHRLKGHSKSITDFDFSLNNQYLCSSSMDRSVRIWDVEKEHCVRIVYDNAEQLCVRFHPVNNNFLLLGNAKKEMSVINFSTGRFLCKISLESNVTSVDMDHTGHVIFAGDAQGCVHSVRINSHTGELSHVHRCRLGLRRKSPIMNVQFKTFSLLANGPVLLASTQDGTIRFFSVTLEIHGYLSLRCSLQLTPWARNVHASFCPILSLEKGEFIGLISNLSYSSLVYACN
ncbi:hypothetical protein L7F22_031476 [Adiantum nelumboides]|nr:hypothetical protein [Adiantum nelumboides]